MACRTIYSPITDKEITSKTWSDIRDLVDNDEKADQLYSQLASPEFTQWFGNWVEPKKSAIVIRHAITPEDVAAKNSGLNDISITEKGRELMKQEARKLETEGLQRIYTSPVKRAKQSSAILGEELKIPIVEENGLRAWDLGKFSSKPEEQFDEKYYVEHPDEPVPGGESFNSYANSFITALSSIYIDSDKWAIMTHSKGIKLIEALEQTGGVLNDKARQLYLKDSAIGNEQSKAFDIYDQNIGKRTEGGEPLLENNKFENSKGETQELKLADNVYQQKEGLPQSEASDATVGKIKEWLKRVGVDWKSVSSISVNGIKYTSNAVADIFGKLIQIMDGKEGVALAEEAMHFGTAIIKQTNPVLYKQMMNKISSYNIYAQVKEQYRNDKDYQNADGTPNIIKLKEEAIGKVLAETYIQSSEGKIETPELLKQSKTWLQHVIDWFKILIGKAGFNPFKEALSELEKTTEQEAQEALAKSKDDVFSQLENSPKQKDIYDSINRMAEKYNIIESPKGEGYINTKTGKEVKHRVSDLSKDYYKRTFKNQGQRTEYQKAVDDLKAESGTEGHSDMKQAMDSLTDENGLLRAEKKDDSNYISQLDPNNRVVYEALRDNLQERMLSFKTGTRFLAEKIVYDPDTDTAGKIDFMAIEPDGKVNILDWKFISLAEKETDIPWYKPPAYQQQMGGYSKILIRNGIKDFGQRRMIPFITRYRTSTTKQGTPKLTLIKLEIGKVNVNIENKDYLLPVGLREEKTGDERVDRFITKLYALYDIIKKKPVEEGRKDIKAEQLNYLYRAIRHLQIKQSFDPLLNQIGNISDTADLAIKAFKDSIYNLSPDEIANKDINEYAGKINEVKDSLSIYRDVDVYFKDFFQQNENKDLKSKLSAAAERARFLIDDINEVQKSYADKFIASKRGVMHLLNPEKAVMAGRRWFYELGRSYTAAMQTLFGMNEEMNSKIDGETRGLIDELKGLLDGINEWQKGKSRLAYVDLVRKKDEKGRKTNQLIDQYDSKFKSGLKTAIEKEDWKWIEKNVKTEEYAKAVDEYKSSRTKYINEVTFPGSPEEQNERKKREMETLNAITDLSKPSGWTNYRLLEQFPIDKWYSKEYSELLKKENAPALYIYQYALKINSLAKETGYLNKMNEKNFLPFIRKGLVEATDFWTPYSKLEAMIRGFTVSENEVGMGSFNTLTGEQENIVPKYFVTDIGQEKVDEEGKPYTDYDVVSDDLIKNLAAYTREIVQYKYRSEYEEQAKLLLDVEKAKQSLPTNRFGKLLRNAEPLETNEKNASLLEKHIKHTIYGQTYIDSDYVDALGGKLGEKYNNAAKAINKAIGINLPILSDVDANRRLSFTKGLHSLNNYFQMKFLGLNLGTSIGRFLGTHYQAFINHGEYMNSADMAKAEWRHASNKVWKDNDELHRQFIREFLPVDDQIEHELHKFTTGTLTKSTIQDFLMGPIRGAHNFVQYVMFDAMMHNAILIDGKIYNARKYYSTSEEYARRYNLPAEERRQMEKSFNDRVNELIEKHSVINHASIKSGRLHIEGLKDESSLVNYKTLIRNIGRLASGNISSKNESLIRMYVLGRSTMLFHNWIPNQAIARFGGLSYTKGIDSYEWGRVRMMAKIIGEDFFHSIGNVKNILMGNDKGVEFLNKLYETKKAEYEEANQKSFEKSGGLPFTKEEFFDMVRQNLKSQIRETLILLTLMGLIATAKAVAPDPEEDAGVKSFYNFSMRTLTKTKADIELFYNPVDLQAMVGGSVFPSIGVLTDAEKMMSNFMQYGFGYAIQDQKLIDSAHPAKYAMQTFPISKEMLNYIAIFMPDVAKSMDIKISPEPYIGR